MLAAIFGVQHQQFLKNLAKQVFRGQEGVVLDRLSVGDYCLGYKGEPVPGTEVLRKGKKKTPKKRYVIVWAEAEWVLKIFCWFVLQRKSLEWITRELNRLGAPKDHRATTKRWRHQYVARLLANRKYIGWWLWGEFMNVRDPLTLQLRQEKRPAAEMREEWLRHFPELQLIDDETFAKAQELLKENADAHAPRRRPNGKLHGSTPAASTAHPRHLLSGLIECGHCGGRMIVGGPHGKYLFCPQYKMGVCPNQTQLRRDRAEKMILEAIGDRILANGEWIELLLENACKSHDDLKRRLPDEHRAAQEALADVTRRISTLLDNAEQQRIPDLDRRLAERQSQREELIMTLTRLDGDQQRLDKPPTREWIEEELAMLHLRLNAGGPAATHALRALVGGKMVVTEVRRPGRKRHYLQGRAQLRLYAVAGAAGVETPASAGETIPTVDVVIDFRNPERYELIADEVKRLWDAGVTEKKMREQLNISRTLFSRAMDFWHEQRGLKRTDGRSSRKRLKGRRKAEQQQQEIMALYDQDLPVGKIAEQLGCCVEIIRECVEQWYRALGLAVPDGRARRREIRLRKSG